ncbi:hypothetical protein O0235_02495 [Tepidiforma flava]|uniref:Uncharacterized protein n=1 Tax=Tepidiforma flava TaxID=3004094 RepID=A0ABY7M7F6_9CHLR|nr:hypothetical protein [Tepidiforma flava]WBL36457.1 hypothetical protein O0235_02495 [Tepidiforma flava]
MRHIAPRWTSFSSEAMAASHRSRCSGVPVAAMAAAARPELLMARAMPAQPQESSSAMMEGMSDEPEPSRSEPCFEMPKPMAAAF